ncbi:hypothetical protein [Streptomyces canus]|uniref:hypothetical protein n=1 Tax=Streptomyces canus TaxID=58343 RepID=UPI003F6D7AD7
MGPAHRPDAHHHQHGDTRQFEGLLLGLGQQFPDRLMCGVPEIALFGDQFLRVAVHGEQVLAHVRQTFRERVGEPHFQDGALHGQQGAQLV